MSYVCSDCGYESDNPGSCPECETPLLKREDEASVVGEAEEKPDEGGMGEDLEEEKEDDEGW